MPAVSDDQVQATFEGHCQQIYVSKSTMSDPAICRQPATGKKVQQLQLNFEAKPDSVISTKSIHRRRNLDISTVPHEIRTYVGTLCFRNTYPVSTKHLPCCKFTLRRLRPNTTEHGTFTSLF